MRHDASPACFKVRTFFRSRTRYDARGGMLRRNSFLVLLCQILSEHSFLNCSVVIHHTTA